MDLYRLQTFATVAREGSIRKACQILYSAPPTVSDHIKALKEEYPVSLFDRIPRGMALTSEGKILLAEAEKILEAIQFKSIDGGFHFGKFPVYSHVRKAVNAIWAKKEIDCPAQNG